MAFNAGTKLLSRGMIAWAPTLTVHDPNPPITLENPAAGGDVTVALTGHASTGAPGTVLVSSTVIVQGQALASAPGDLDHATITALLGAFITGTTGTTVNGSALVLLGQSSTALAGDLDNETITALLGAFIASAAGTLTYVEEAANEVALTGAFITGALGIVTPSAPATVLLTGQSMTGSTGTLGVGSAGEPGGGIPGETQFIRKMQRLGPLVRQRVPRRF